MRPNSRNLALRDAAAAALVGAIGDDFGNESDFGSEMGYEFGIEDFEPIEDSDWGFEFGASPLENMTQKAAMVGRQQLAYAGAQGSAYGAPIPPPAVAAQLWQRHAQHRSATSRRAMLLEPNKGSAVKVERYVFAVNDTITLGTAKALSMSGQPDTNIRPQRCTINAPAPGFATISEIKVANVSVTVGGTQDAFDFSPNGVGQSLDMPTLSPSNKATVLGNYTGFVPPGYVGASSYTMCASFKGPASIVA